MAVGLGSITEIINIQLSRNQVSGMGSLVTITERLVERLNEQRTSQAVDFDSNVDYRRSRRQIFKLQAFKDKISDSVSAATKAKNAASFIETHLDSMKTKLQTILGSTSDEDRATLATEFDELYSKINSRADGANQLVNHQSVNLIGNTNGPDWTTRDLYSPTSQSGGFTKIEGSYLGTKHEIIDADGYAWRYDEGANLYKQYLNDGTNVATGAEYSATDMTVQSFDHSDDSVTLSNGTDTITGTLNRGGLGVLKSEYYSSFADDTAVQNAIDDIDAAIIYFDTNSTRLTANASLLQGNTFLIKQQIAQLEEEVADIVTKEIKENGARNRAANLKFTLAISNINLISQQNSGLIQNMLQLTQPLDRASGIFGMMGY
jgi:hypothetical protein